MDFRAQNFLNSYWIVIDSFPRQEEDRQDSELMRRQHKER